MSKIVNLGLTLLFWATLSGASLAMVYVKTSVQIEKTKAANILRMQREILPQAERFVTDTGSGIVTGIDRDGRSTGLIVSVSPKGYAGPVEMLVGIDASGKVASLRIVQQGETPGLGNRVAKDSFLSQYTGKATGEIILKKDDAVRGTIDAIAGATISSRAVTAGVRQALIEALKENEKEQGMPSPAVARRTGAL